MVVNARIDGLNTEAAEAGLMHDDRKTIRPEFNAKRCIFMDRTKNGQVYLQDQLSL